MSVLFLRDKGIIGSNVIGFFNGLEREQQAIFIKLFVGSHQTNDDYKNFMSKIMANITNTELSGDERFNSLQVALLFFRVPISSRSTVNVIKANDFKQVLSAFVAINGEGTVVWERLAELLRGVYVIDEACVDTMLQVIFNVLNDVQAQGFIRHVGLSQNLMMPMEVFHTMEVFHMMDAFQMNDDTIRILEEVIARRATYVQGGYEQLLITTRVTLFGFDSSLSRFPALPPGSGGTGRSLSEQESTVTPSSELVFGQTGEAPLYNLVGEVIKSVTPGVELSFVSQEGVVPVISHVLETDSNILLFSSEFRENMDLYLEMFKLAESFGVIVVIPVGQNDTEQSIMRGGVSNLIRYAASQNVSLWNVVLVGSSIDEIAAANDWAPLRDLPFRYLLAPNVGTVNTAGQSVNVFGSLYSAAAISGLMARKLDSELNNHPNLTQRQRSYNVVQSLVESMHTAFANGGNRQGASMTLNSYFSPNLNNRNDTLP
jgi:hypothetical protein